MEGVEIGVFLEVGFAAQAQGPGWRAGGGCGERGGGAGSWRTGMVLLRSRQAGCAKLKRRRGGGSGVIEGVRLLSLSFTWLRAVGR